jgi:ABC-type uncharacterized transport system substrate-binding protein
MKSKTMPFLISVIISLFLAGCAFPEKGKRKIFYINSYHQGYGSSDDVMEGIKEVVGESAELMIAFMDTKRNSDSASIGLKVREVLESIRSFQPDVIIASDDDAIKYIIEPHFKNGNIPIVFCGVNWSADAYRLPAEHVTGMLEVLPFSETVSAVRHAFPHAKSLTVLSENSNSECRNMEVMQHLFDELALKVNFTLVDDFENWKAGFVEASEMADIIYLPTNGAIKNWNNADAATFVEQHISKSVITCDDFMMPYAVFGLTKVAKEQGEWAAATALKILDGAKPSSIAITKNTQSQGWINLPLADKIGFELPDEIMENIKIIRENNF